jgi:sugar lactone lactonase YvrE
MASPVAGVENFLVRFDPAAGQLSEGVTVAADGTVYASLSPLGQLVRVSDDGTWEVVGQVEGLQEGDLGMLGVTAHEDGSVWGGVFSGNADAHGVWRFDVATGAAERVPGTEQVGLPNAVAFGSDGTAYITDTIAGAVWTVPPDGTAEAWLEHELLLGNEDLGFPFPVGANGIALDEEEGTVYVAVLEQGTIVTIPIGADGAAGEPEILATLGTADSPARPDGIVFDAADNLYIALPIVNMVLRMAPNGIVSTFATASDGLDGPASVAVDDDAGVLYVANFSIALAPHVPPGGAGPGILMFELGG